MKGVHGPAGAPPGGDRHDRSRSARWAAVGLGGAVVVAAGLLGMFIVGGGLEGSGGAPQTPSASPSPSGSVRVASPSASAPPPSGGSPQATPTAGGATGLAWTTVRATDGSESRSEITAITPWSDGLIAAGVRYLAPAPGNVGPEPIHEAVIWQSGDGRDWTEVETTGIPPNLNPRAILATGDGRLVLVGPLGQVEEGDDYIRAPGGTGFAVSADGRQWSELETSDLRDRRVVDVRSGARGHLALARVENAEETDELWHSEDGISWELVRTEEGRSLRIGAGDEGFVAVSGSSAFDESAEPYAVASSDGVEWFEASAPPPTTTSIAPRDGDWFTTGWPPVDDDGFTGEDVEVWFSANGLEWRRHATLDLERITLDEMSHCDEIPVGALGIRGRMLVSTAMTYPCSESWFDPFGRQLMSPDGAEWTVLPFEPWSGDPLHFGSGVMAAAALDGRLVLVGMLDHHGAFWIGETR